MHIKRRASGRPVVKGISESLFPLDSEHIYGPVDTGSFIEIHRQWSSVYSHLIDSSSVIYCSLKIHSGKINHTVAPAAFVPAVWLVVWRMIYFVSLLYRVLYVPTYPVWTHLSTYLGDGEGNKAREIFGK